MKHPHNRAERLKIKAKKEHTLAKKSEGLRKEREILELKELDHELREELPGKI